MRLRLFQTSRVLVLVPEAARRRVVEVGWMGALDRTSTFSYYQNTRLDDVRVRVKT